MAHDFGREQVRDVSGSSGGGGGASTIADGANVVEGSLADAAVVTDAPGTISAKLRGIIKLLVEKIVVLPYATPANIVSGSPAALTDNAAHDVIAADSGVGLKYYVTDVIVTNSHATVGTLVTIQDDEGSPTVICQGYAAAVGGGFTHHFACPVPTAANAHIHAICGTTGSNVYVTVVAFKAA